MEPTDTFAVRSSLLTSNVEKMIKNVGDLDIMKLDVKVSKLKTDKVEDVDFFADMKPDIPKAASALEQFEEKLKINESPKKHSLLVLTKYFRLSSHDNNISSGVRLSLMCRGG